MVIKYIRKLLSSGKKPSARQQAETAPQPATLEVHHRPISQNLIDADAAKIVKRLRRFGHTAYIVGGGVRDLLLNRTPKDFDIGTSARPNEIRKLFRNCRIIGRRFRLAHIYFHDKIIEVATFRSNQPDDIAAAAAAAAAEAEAAHAAAAGDLRTARKLQTERTEADLLIRSDNVFGTPETDALRRDFTINALFYDIENGNVIDYVGGIADLDTHLLRMIGDPEVRLREDPIRILRAIRLAGRLGFQIHTDLWEGIQRHRSDIRLAAPPRILEDLLRMFRRGGAETAMALLHESGVDRVVIPELLAAAAPGDRELEKKALHALDSATARGTEFSNATLLALVYYPYLRAAVESAAENGGNAPYEAIDKHVSSLEQRLVVPKRDRDRIRQILIAQKRFLAKKGGGRKGSTSSFVRKPFFPEAFDLFDIITSATGEHREEVKRWRARISSAAVASDGVSLGPELPAETKAPAHRAPRRRRRRGRRAGRDKEGRTAKQAPQRRESSESRRARSSGLEPLALTDLAPGENPYGDAIAVPVLAEPRGGEEDAGRSIAGRAAETAARGPAEAQPARKRRRRRGGKGRKKSAGKRTEPGGPPPVEGESVSKAGE